MSEIFEINSSIKNYTVCLAENGAISLIKDYSELVIIDQKVNKLWPSLNIDTPIQVEAVENNKTLATVGAIIESLREKGATRNSTVLAIGGGIIQDVSTFCASSYMRGVNWIYVPTTLLGMVDSCIGGKSSINVGKYKNIAGNFYPPKQILVDVAFCQTLSEQQLVEGLCESVKICYAHSRECFDKYLTNLELSKPLHDIDFENIVSLSLKTKKEFIEKDEFDQNIRLLLNFGHTFGHALEGASEFAISHGIAVGLGMISAYKLSIDLGMIEAKNPRVLELLNHVTQLLTKVDGLYRVLNSINMSDAVEKFKSDKKHEKNNYVAILYDREGCLVRHKFERNKKSEKLIVESFNYLRNYKDEI